MSLRDQLVATGLASKKDAKRVDRELKQARKADQASRKRQSILDAEARQQAEAEAEARRASLATARSEAEARKEAIERELRLKNLIVGNRVRPGTGQPFWHRSLDGRYLLRIEVSSGIAYQLRCGEAAVAAHVRTGSDEVEYVILPRRAALKLATFAPERLVFFHEDTEGIGAPELAPLRRQWEPSLAAHRARPEELARWQSERAHSG